MPFVRVRFLALAGCAFCLVAAWTVLEMRMSGRGAQSALGALACLVAFSVGLACGGLAVLPDRFWQVAQSATMRSLDQLAEIATPISTRFAIGQIIAAGVAFLLIASHIGPLQILANNSDQGAYLQTATEIQRDGGVLQLLVNLMTGRFSEANRHPLYLALLSLWPTPIAGQLLSAAFGLATIWGMAPLIMRKFGASVAAVFCTLLATNFACCYASTLVMCESLLTLLATAGWLWFGFPETEWSRRSSETGEPGGVSPRTPLMKSPGADVARLTSFQREMQSPFLAGCCLGTLYLTKGTGLLWLAGYCVWLVVSPNRVSTTSDSMDANSISKTGRLSRLLISLAFVVTGWVLIASPLLVRNWLRFESLTYNVNSWLLFVDEFKDPNALAESTSLGEAARQYWESHSIRQIAERGAMGLVWETFILIRSLGPAPLGESRVLFGAPLLGLAVLGLLIERRVNTLLLPIWLAICLPVFGWYVPVAAGERFILPLVPPLLVFASIGIVRLAHLWQRERATLMIPIGCMAWLVVWTALTLRISELS